MGRVIALTGFMGSGKSAVGRTLAEDLRWDFLDLDDRIEESAGLPIARIFAERGEAAFRDLEVSELEVLLPSADRLVLALGGGTVTLERARELLSRFAFLVYLDVDADTCWVRTEGAGGRPLARERSAFEALEDQRRPLYLEAADAVIDGCGPVKEIAGRVKAALPPGLLPGPGQLWSLRLVRTARPSLIVGGPGVRAQLREYAERAASEGKRARIVSDRQVWEAWGDEVSRLLSPLIEGDAALTLPPGESSKRLEKAGECWQWLAEQGFRRGDLVVALGGGVVGDLAGFVAATYMRGVGYWQIPTSLVAQVDSSVGGKVAINLPAGKNLVGGFYQPELVVIDPDFLQTLPHDELLNGLGEVVKYALLEGEGLLTQLEDSADRLLSFDAAILDAVVERCVRLKAEVVEADETEKGRRAVLNLGHTFAHALEAAEGYRGAAHGRAVALGLLVSLRVSESLLGLDGSLRERVSGLLNRLELATRHALPPEDALRSAAARDKKVSGLGSGFVALRGLGDPVWGVDVPWETLREAIEVVRA